MSKKSSIFAAGIDKMPLVHNSNTKISTSMAKQYGIHQIRGKVGQMSYYRQSGVKPSLIRGINQGMSARVKNGEEYANTRRNNAEFGAACGVAAVCGDIVKPKFRPMFLTFSQAKLAKKALELIKLDTTEGATWGTRSMVNARWPQMIESLNSMSKNPFDRFLASVSQVVTTGSGGRLTDTITVEWSADIENHLASIGADGVNLYITLASSLAGKYDADSGAYLPAQSVIMALDNEDGAYDTTEFTINYLPRTILGGYNTCTIVAVPFREVNNSVFELQESAAFQAYELPSA